MFKDPVQRRAGKPASRMAGNEGEARNEAQAMKNITGNIKSAGIPAGVIAQNTGLTKEDMENFRILVKDR